MERRSFLSFVEGRRVERIMGVVLGGGGEWWGGVGVWGGGGGGMGGGGGGGWRGGGGGGGGWELHRAKVSNPNGLKRSRYIF